jgi:hypothetical protein
VRIAADRKRSVGRRKRDATTEGPEAGTWCTRVALAVKGNLDVDWTEPHRPELKAAVGCVLRHRGMQPTDFDPLTNAVLAQATAIWHRWPHAA